ncbi:MAG: DNA polymerase III subunit chi [Silicimonas sp.]|nr:DNA polymerase III subunit chi [Silicimonas sp.]NND19427.1 DNA polymerase III subunit chi [Silicimonas sp.]
MGAVYFYHLTERPLEATLPVLLNKALEAGWRVAVRGRDPELLDRLDRQLWHGDGFLPHGQAGGDHDALQPVLLTTSTEAANQPSCVMSVAGAEVTADEVKSLERVCILFDGADSAALEEARNQWRTLTGAGVAAQYWAEEDRRWVKKADSEA